MLDALRQFRALDLMTGNFQIFDHIAFRKYRMPLPGENHSLFNPFVGLVPGNIFAFEDDLAVDVDSFAAFALFLDLHVDDESGNCVHQGGFAGAVGTDNTDDFPRILGAAGAVEAIFSILAIP